MNRNISKLLVVISFCAFTMVSCEKDNELEGVAIYNPYDHNSGIELIQLDSINKFYGAVPHLKGYFHINQAYVDTHQVHRLILYRNGLEKGRLSPGNFTFFVDITAMPGATYNYQLSLIMKDSSYTKINMPFFITF